MDSFNIVDNSNSAQYMAATTTEKNVLVLAGAGTGKTRTIINRATHLLQKGVSPDKICILAFTKRAADEIHTRLKENIGTSGSKIQASTFHAWSLSIIKSFPSIFGGNDFTILDRDDQTQLIKVILKGDVYSELPKPKKICDVLSLSRNKLKSIAESLVEIFPNEDFPSDIFTSVANQYNIRKQKNNYLDYDDILELLIDKIENSEQLKKSLSKKIEHLLIDEMQDTNPLQWKLLQHLNTKSHLFCVGDDAQSIYGFRGADFKSIHTFSEKIKGSKVYKLTYNYRSTQEILNISNWLLTTSSLNYGKQLTSIKKDGEVPILLKHSDSWDEAKWIVDSLKSTYAEGMRWQDHMLLVRNSVHARIIEAKFLQNKIPYQVIGGGRFFDSSHIRDLISFLKVANNHHDEIAWMRFLTLWKGVGDRKANILIRKILKSPSVEEVLLILKSDNTIPDVIFIAYNDLLKAGSNLLLVFDKSLKFIQDEIKNKYNANWLKIKNDFATVRELAKTHTSISSFIDEYVLNPIHRNQDKPLEDSVRICTIHSAKGSEAKVCYVINVSVGDFPDFRDISDNERKEEERRVLYVALTRAKEKLVITKNISNEIELTKDQIEKYSLLGNLPDNYVNTVDISKKSKINNCSDSFVTIDKSILFKHLKPYKILNSTECNLPKFSFYLYHGFTKNINISMLSLHVLSIKEKRKGKYSLYSSTFEIKGFVSSLDGEKISESRCVTGYRVNSKGYIIPIFYQSWQSFGTKNELSIQFSIPESILHIKDFILACESLPDKAKIGAD